MKRRVGIAQALLGGPQLLIVDEPTVGLDPEERARLRALLSEVAARCTVILSTHIIEDIGQSCHDLAVLYRGQVIYRGAPRALIEAARGAVWAVEARNGETPTGDDGAPLTLVASMPMADGGVLHRVVGQPAARHHAQPAEPTLEEAYIVAMAAAKTGVATTI
jgi:ABC-type multidrug transport system ATPase subunit